jgi:hypothetical protein
MLLCGSLALAAYSAMSVGFGRLGVRFWGDGLRDITAGLLAVSEVRHQ